MPETQSSPRKRLVFFGLLALFWFQLISALLCFKTPYELFRPEPIINIDWCSQYYWSYAARKFFESGRRLFGFDPYYMAGYPLDFIFNSSLPVQLANIILWPLPLGLIIKWFFFLSFLAVPFIFYYAARNFELSPKAGLVSASLAVSYFWLGEDALFGNWGMISGAFLLNFFLLAASGFYRYLKRQDRRSFILFVILLTLSALIHKTFIILIGLPFLILTLIFGARMGSKAWFGIAAAVIFAYLVNSFWLVPFLHFLPNKIEDPNTTFFQNIDFLRFFKDLVPSPYPGVALGRLVILIPALGGIYWMARRKETRDLFWFSALSAAAFFVFVYFGSEITVLRNLQPYRYLTALFFLLTPAAGIALEKLSEAAAARSKALAKTLPWIFFAGLLGLQLVPSFRLFYAITPLTSQWPGKVLQLKAWLEKNTDLSGRIMMEDINKWEGKLVPYGASRFVGILPGLMPRYLVGGPLPNAFIRHHYASFHDGYFLNKRISGYNDQELREKLGVYNIRWAVAWSPEAKDRLKQFGHARLAAKFDDLEVFEIRAGSNWFLVGSGDLAADYDRIELENLKPENNLVVLKMHWLDGFRASPECQLFRYGFGGDPIGFIGLKNPAPKVSLTYER